MIGLMRNLTHQTLNLFKSAVTFFPQETRCDKMHFIVPWRILNKAILISSLSSFFFSQFMFLAGFYWSKREITKSLIVYDG